MINNVGPIDQTQNIQLEEIDDVAGAANVTPSYLTSEVNATDEVSAVSGDSTAISGASSSSSSIGSSETTPSYSTSGSVHNRHDLSNYILNVTPDQLQEIFLNRLSDQFTYNGTILRDVLSDNVSVYDNFESMEILSELREKAPHIFGNADAPSRTTSGADDSGGFTRVGEVDSYVDPYDPAVYDLVQDMKDQGIITDGMTYDQIVTAVFNYIVENFDYIADGQIDTWSTAAETIRHGGGDCEDLSFLLASSLMAALIDSGMTYDAANQRVQGVALSLGSGDGHICVTYTADDGTMRVLDPSSSTGTINDITDAAVANVNSSNVLFVFNDSTVAVVDNDYDYSSFVASTFTIGNPCAPQLPPEPEINLDNINLSDPASIQQFIDQLEKLGIITAGMGMPQIAMAMFYTVLDELGKADPSLAVTAYNIIYAALIQLGMSPDAAKNAAIEGILNGVIQAYSGNGAELDRVTDILHPPAPNLVETTPNCGFYQNRSLEGLTLARELAEQLVDAGIITDDFSFTYTVYGNWQIRGQHTFTVEVYSNGDHRVYTGNYYLDYVNTPAEYLDYIYDTQLDLPATGDIYDIAVAIDNEFDSILEAYDEKDFWHWGKHGFKIPNEGRINALMQKMQKLYNLMMTISMLHKAKQQLRNVVQEEMEGIKGYRGMDTSKMVGKLCQNAMMIIMKLTQTLLEEIMKFNQARYEELMEEAEEANDSSMEKIEDALTFGENTREVLEAQMEATEAYMDACAASMKALEQLQLAGFGEQEEGSDDPTELNDPINNVEQEIEERLEELLGRTGHAIRNGDNGYLWADNDFLMGLRDDIVGAMNTMRCVLIIATSRQDLRNAVHEEMTGVSGRASEKEAIQQMYENRYAWILMTFDRMVANINLYTQLHNQLVYLEAQYNKYGGGFFDAFGDFWEDLVTFNWADLPEDIANMFQHLPGFMRVYMDFWSTLLGWLPIIGPIINLEDALMVQWCDAYYDDEINIPQSNYNPEDTRTNTGDSAFDLMNHLDYEIGGTLSGINSNLFITADDGMYQLDYVGAAMYMDMLTGFQNLQRIVMGAVKAKQEGRELVHMEMTGMGSRQQSQLVWTANAAEMQQQMAQFSAQMANLMARQTAHNLERSQELAIDRMMDQALNNLWNIIPVLGSIPAHFSNLNSAMNDPAYGMDLGASPHIAYFEQKAENAQGTSAEARIEDLLEEMYMNLINNGLIYAGGVSTMGIDPKLETSIKEQFRGLATVMYILTELKKFKHEARDLVHKEMTGVKSSVPGQMSEQVMNAELSKIMKLIDYFINWLEEVIAVDDRADQAEARVDRLDAQTAQIVIMSMVEAILMCIPVVGWIAAAIIEIVKGIINHVWTMATEDMLLDQVEQGGFGGLEGLPTVDGSAGSGAVQDVLQDAEESIYSGINSDLMSTLDGGHSYVNAGFQATAHHDITRIFNLRRLIAKLHQSLQDLRNEVHMYMTGVGGRSTDLAENVYNFHEQVAHSQVDALFRRLNRMSERQNMIHQAQMEYQMNMIMSYINLAMSFIKAFLKAQSGRLKDKVNDLNKEATKIRADRAKGIDVDPKHLKDLNDQVKDMNTKLSHYNYASQILTLCKPLLASIIDLVKEIQKYAGNADKNMPQLIERKGKGSGSRAERGEGNEDSGGHSWVDSLESMETNIVNYQIMAANSQMSIANARSRIQMWQKFIDAVKENFLKILAGSVTSTKEHTAATRKTTTVFGDGGEPKDVIAKNTINDRHKLFAAIAKGPDQLAKELIEDPQLINRVYNRAGSDSLAQMMGEDKVYAFLKWVTDPIGTWMDLNNVDFTAIAQGIFGDKVLGLSPKKAQEAAERANNAMVGLDATIETASREKEALEGKRKELTKKLEELEKIDPKKRTPEQNAEIANIKAELNEIDKKIAQWQARIDEATELRERAKTDMKQYENVAGAAGPQDPTKTEKMPETNPTKWSPTANTDVKNSEQRVEEAQYTVNGKPISEVSDNELIAAIQVLRQRIQTGFRIISINMQLAKSDLSPERRADLVKEKADLVNANPDLFGEGKLFGKIANGVSETTEMLQQQIAHVKQTIGTIQQDLAVIIKEVDRRNGSREARNRVEIPRMAEASVPTSGADLRAISNTFGQMFGGIFKPGGRREDGSNAADNQSETVVAANNNRVSSRFENVPDNDILAEYKRRLEQLATIETV